MSISKKVTISGHIYWLQRKWEKQGIFTFVNCDMEGIPGYTKVIPHSFTVEVPDEFDPRPAQLAALNKKELALKAAFAKAMMELADDRAKLLAITNEVVA